MAFLPAIADFWLIFENDHLFALAFAKTGGHNFGALYCGTANDGVLTISNKQYPGQLDIRALSTTQALDVDLLPWCDFVLFAAGFYYRVICSHFLGER